MNQQQMMKQARKLQEQLAKVQADLANEMLTGSAAAGSVEITLDGHGSVRKVKIDPAAVDPQDVETLEDLISVALSDAQAKVAALSQSRMGPLTGGLGIPGL
ncbi:MAG: YbaB/EbfC family nucleoid-associated protein [Candidatus Eremiobacteraeota bacterium]|nr:YbaB/EbfC family nucleoid-associated protein [Candidatus Eremiobacteraeota bacterium]